MGTGNEKDYNWVSHIITTIGTSYQLNVPHGLDNRTKLLHNRINPNFLPQKMIRLKLIICIKSDNRDLQYVRKVGPKLFLKAVNS